jgi:hypothetical protein
LNDSIKHIDKKSKFVDEKWVRIKNYYLFTLIKKHL